MCLLDGSPEGPAATCGAPGRWSRLPSPVLTGAGSRVCGAPHSQRRRRRPTGQSRPDRRRGAPLSLQVNCSSTPPADTNSDRKNSQRGLFTEEVSPLPDNSTSSTSDASDHKSRKSSTFPMSPPAPRLTVAHQLKPTLLRHNQAKLELHSTPDHQSHTIPNHSSKHELSITCSLTHPIYRDDRKSAIHWIHRSPEASQAPCDLIQRIALSRDYCHHGQGPLRPIETRGSVMYT